MQTLVVQRGFSNSDLQKKLVPGPGARTLLQFSPMHAARQTGCTVPIFRTMLWLPREEIGCLRQEGELTSLCGSQG